MRQGRCAWSVDTYASELSTIVINIPIVLINGMTISSFQASRSSCIFHATLHTTQAKSNTLQKTQTEQKAKPKKNKTKS